MGLKSWPTVTELLPPEASGALNAIDVVQVDGETWQSVCPVARIMGVALEYPCGKRTTTTALLFPFASLPLGDVNTTAGIGHDAGNDAIRFDLLRGQRGESRAILRAGDFNDVIAHLAQILITRADTLICFIAAVLWIAESRNPRAIYADIVSGVAGRKPSRTQVRADTVADVG